MPICEVCPNRAIFAESHAVPATRCYVHKDRSMVNLEHRQRVMCNCGKHYPTYGLPDGQGPRKYCSECKEPGMVLRRTPFTCQLCDVTPTFGIVGSRPTHCVKHKEVNMVNLTHPSCHCGKRASYGFVGGHPTTCCKHKMPLMTLLTAKRCELCETTAMYGYPSDRVKLRCTKHKVETMIYLLSSCAEPDCERYPNYNFKGQPPMYCNNHKQPGMLNVKNKQCEICCYYTASKKSPFDNKLSYCARCFHMAYPEERSSYRLLSKQRFITANLIQAFPDLAMICDKKIYGSDRLYRPDILIIGEYHNIIIEVDENMHNNEDYHGHEEERIVQIYSDLKCVPLTVIRFNPDGYTDENGFKHKTSINVSKEAVASGSPEWPGRFQRLTDELNKALILSPEDAEEQGIKTVHLFYSPDKIEPKS